MAKYMTRAQEKKAGVPMRICYETSDCKSFDSYEKAAAAEKHGRPIYLVCKIKGYGGIEENVDEQQLVHGKPTLMQLTQFYEHCRILMNQPL